MRGLWTVSFGFALALCAQAQEPAVQSGQFYGPIVSGEWVKNILAPPPAKNRPAITTTPQITPAPIAGAASVPLCSIPLLKAQVPEGMHFKIRQITPRADAVVPMPQVKPPAPSCDSLPPSVTK